MMKIREVYCDRWFLPDETWGITIYPFIFYNKSKYNITLRRHEWIHVKQVRDIGWIKFYVSYIKQIIGQDYMDVSFEKEAYRLQHNAEYAPWVDDPPKIYGK